MPVHVMQALYVPTPTVPTLVPAMTASQEMGHTVKVTSPSYRLRVRFKIGFLKIGFLREHPAENHAVLKYGSTSTLSDFVQILCRVSL